MTSMLSSHGLVLATAMVVSSSVLLLAFSKQFSTPLQLPTQSLRSCLTSGERKKKKNKEMKKKKKRVQFAETVKDTKGNGKEYRKNHHKKTEKTTREVEKICRSDEMPANRIALYNGILRDRLHRIECSY
ncbi:uncharacterized protein LOC110821088 [Carica papaya]|uniref:uncharacterized protein LOC110821088 n=1 Tax=Carica papaya TaxID=3649 RepID=UPI000B8D0B38|nr:uncharacterized protein LOC110821088 [Carica papaya]